jgi:hypothetical protein
MEYELTRLTHDDSPAVSITAAEFEEIRRAGRNLGKALAIEETYHLVLENFQELEVEMLRLTLRRALRVDFEWTAMMEDLHLLDRRLVNLLSTARLYLDSTRNTVGTMYGKNSSHFASVSAATSEQYDSRLGYRVMEALRNHIQHCGLAIAFISFDGEWPRNDSDERAFRRRTLMMRVDPLRLEEDDTFKPSVIAEMKANSAACDLKPLVRDYITGIGQVHGRVREMLAADLPAWETVVRDTIARYLKHKGAKPPGLMAIAYEDNVLREHVPLFEEPMKRRVWLAKRNPTGPRMLDFIVTSG